MASTGGLAYKPPTQKVAAKPKAPAKPKQVSAKGTGGVLAPPEPKIVTPKAPAQAAVPAPTPPSPSAGSAASTANAWMGDPERLAALAQVAHTRTTGIADVQAAAAEDERNTQSSREQLAQTLAGNRHGTVINANKLGLLRSGKLDRQQGDLTKQYGADLTNLEGAFTGRAADRARSIESLNTAASLAQPDIDSDAIKRQVALDQQLGVPDAMTGVAQALAQSGAAPPFTSVAHTDSKGRKGVIHVYPDGRRVFVPSR